MGATQVPKHEAFERANRAESLLMRSVDLAHPRTAAHLQPPPPAVAVPADSR
jgi:hypothetical protein